MHRDKHNKIIVVVLIEVIHFDRVRSIWERETDNVDLSNLIKSENAVVSLVRSFKANTIFIVISIVFW